MFFFELDFSSSEWVRKQASGRSVGRSVGWSWQIKIWINYWSFWKKPSLQDIISARKWKFQVKRGKRRYDFVGWCWLTFDVTSKICRIQIFSSFLSFSVKYFCYYTRKKSFCSVFFSERFDSLILQINYSAPTRRSLSLFFLLFSSLWLLHAITQELFFPIISQVAVVRPPSRSVVGSGRAGYSILTTIPWQLDADDENHR